jgi:hypothetical protein
VSASCPAPAPSALLGAGLHLNQLSRFPGPPQGADLRAAKLTYVDLKGADLSAANLTGARMARAHLDGANLRGTNLTVADLKGADGLTQDQLDSACGSERTQLDPALTIKPCPPDPPAAGSSK